MKPLIPALFAGGLLLAAQTCFAEDQWSGLLPNAEKEFAALSENGRAAYKQALIACSLYADDYGNAYYENQCKTAYKSFKVEFGAEIIGLIFNDVIILSSVTEQNIKLGAGLGDGNRLGKTSIATLQKIYHDGNLHAASITTAPIRSAPRIGGQILIPLQRQGGTFVVPVQINKAITLNFVVDSGASDVSIPADVVLTLIRTGTIKDADFVGTQTYKLADGSTAPSTTFRIRSLKANTVEIENVKASTAPAAGELLLGQSFLSRFKSWSIDNAKQVLVLAQ